MATRLLLLAGDRLSLAFAGARIGVRALAANRQALAMTKPAIAGEVHQPLDVHRDLTTKIAFDRIARINRFTDLKDFLIAQVLNATLRRDAELGGDLLGFGAPNAVDIGKRNLHALVGRDIDARNTCHCAVLLAPQDGWHPAPSRRLQFPPRT